MSSKTDDRPANLPDGWPTMFSDPENECPHHFAWETGEGAYQCIYCEIQRSEP